MERVLVDVEADAVAGPVDEPVAVAGVDEHLAAGCVDVPGGDTRVDGVEPGLLCDRDEPVHLALERCRLAHHPRAGHVGVVSVDECTHVDDHRVALDDACGPTAP